MTFDPQDFTHHKPIHRSHIKTANGECVQVQSAGSVHVSPSMHLKNCLLVPSLSHKLLSVSQLTRELNCTILMTSTGCVVQDAQTGTVIGHGTERGGLYYVDETTQKGQALLARGSSDQLFWLWHRRLGHPSLAYLNFLFPSVKNKMLTLDCETCVLAKSHRHSYLSSVSRTSTPFSLIHSDVWGPAPVFATSTYSYYVLFVDDCTRMSWVYFLKHKSEVFSVFVTFYNMLHTQFRAAPKIIRSDNGGEFVNSSMKRFFFLIMA